MSVNGIKPYINLFVQKAGSQLARKPQTVSVPVQELGKLKPVVDTLEFTTSKRISVSDVKNLFPNGEIEADYLLKDV